MLKMLKDERIYKTNIKLITYVCIYFENLVYVYRLSTKVNYKLILNIIVFIANSTPRCSLEFSCLEIIARTTLGISNSYAK